MIHANIVLIVKLLPVIPGIHNPGVHDPIIPGIPHEQTTLTHLFGIGG